MEGNDRQPWLLIAIASLGLVLGAIALVVSLNAKSTSDDAATQASVGQVSSELSNLVDRLGIAEASLTGQQQQLQGKAKNAVRESRSAVANLSNRLDRLERQTAALNATAKQTNALSQQVASLNNRVDATNAQVRSLSQKVAKLNKRVNAQASGGQSAP